MITSHTGYKGCVCSARSCAAVWAIASLRPYQVNEGGTWFSSAFILGCSWAWHLQVSETLIIRSFFLKSMEMSPPWAKIKITLFKISDMWGRTSVQLLTHSWLSPQLHYMQDWGAVESVAEQHSLLHGGVAEMVKTNLRTMCYSLVIQQPVQK